MSRLKTVIAGLTCKNPVMPAAGPPVKDARAIKKAVAGGVGAIVTKTISVSGASVPRPCMARVRGGFLNAELWSELPPEEWLQKEYPSIQGTGLPVIISLGYTAEDISKLAPKVACFAQALELSTHYLGNDTTPVMEAVRAAREVVDLPVFVKLSPQGDIISFARAAEAAGADGVVVINSFGPCLDIDLATGKPLLGSQNGYGWLSGRAIFPLALRAVFEAARAVKIPVIGVGGINNGKDAVKMIMAGAAAIQVCTAAILKGPEIFGKITREIEAFMYKKGFNSLTEFQGLTLKMAPRENNLTKRIPRVIKENCTLCGTCVCSCPYEAITEGKEQVAINSEKCFGCGLCLSRCCFGALTW